MMINESESQIRRDLHYLAGTLPHRGAYTENEKVAAEYLRDRFLQHTPDVEIDGFTSIESYYYFFASYYGEFLFVALAAFWWPTVAFLYGLVVMLLYLGEFTSYRLAARLLPQFESQNVVARFMSPNPERLIVITSNYDSPKEGVLSSPGLKPYLRPMHIGIVICMMVVLLSCVFDALHGEVSGGFHVHLALRWTAVAYLLCAAVLFYFHESGGEFSSGAVDNGSGAAALLALAQRFEGGALPDKTEVWLVATGAKDAWMSGMYHFVRSHRLDRKTTFFVHLDKLNSTELRYLKGEGLLHRFPFSPEMNAAAERVSGRYGVTSSLDCGAPSDALVTLARGYRAMRITSEELVENTSRLPAAPDGLARIDYAAVATAVNFTEAIVRDIATTPGPVGEKASLLPRR